MHSADDVLMVEDTQGTHPLPSGGVVPVLRTVNEVSDELGMS